MHMQKMSCWNPKCANIPSDEYEGHAVCHECLVNVFNAQCYCPGCGLGYGPTEEPEEAENYYIGCDYCEKWTHRFCDDLKIGFYDRHFVSKYACPACRVGGAECSWNWLVTISRSCRASEDEAMVKIPDEALQLVYVQETVKSTSHVHPCILAGFDFLDEKNPVVLMCLNGNSWQQWNQKPTNIFAWGSEIDESRKLKYSQEWTTVSSEMSGKSLNDWPKLAKKRLSVIRSRLTAQETSEKVELASGLVDPGEDTNMDEEQHAEVALEFEELQVVWAKVQGMLWAPAIVSFAYRQNQDCPYVLFFLEGFPRKVVDENRACENLPRWLSEEQETILSPDEIVAGVKYAYLPALSVKSWNCPQSDGFEKQIKSSKRRDLVEAVSFAHAIIKGSANIPMQIKKDSLARKRAQNHTEESFRAVQVVKPAIKLHHLKLFIETNMVEMHWRVTARARQYVKVVHDEYYGGWHLVAAQDWPTDREVAEGTEVEVFLVYPGEILTAAEAHAMESASPDELHADSNRYVAEIPNTATVMDKSGNTNINLSGTNLYVNGIKYSDPTSDLWAPGPTVNHERSEYCKLEPHHSTTENMRGFWLQRKRGEIIYRGEPLFWSYDCGAGKFDEDFGLTGNPPPAGWRSSRKRVKTDPN